MKILSITKLPYLPLWLRIILSIVAAQYIVIHANNASLVQIINGDRYLVSLVYSFWCSLLIINCTHYFIIYLDERYNWHLQMFYRLFIQFSFACLMIVVYYLLTRLYFFFLNDSFIKSGFMTTEFHTCIWMVFALNLFYFGWYFAKNSKDLNEKELRNESISPTVPIIDQINEEEELFKENTPAPPLIIDKVNDEKELPEQNTPLIPPKPYLLSFDLRIGSVSYPIAVEDIICIKYSDKTVICIVKEKNDVTEKDDYKKYFFEGTLEQLYNLLDHEVFLDINRSQIYRISYISELKKLGNGRGIIITHPEIYTSVSNIVPRSRLKRVTETLDAYKVAKKLKSQSD